MIVPPTGVDYAIDSGSFAIPNGLTFTSAANLMVGQEVSVVVVPGSITTTSGSGSSTPIAGPAATTFTTNSITLEPSQITSGGERLGYGQYERVDLYNQSLPKLLRSGEVAPPQSCRPSISMCRRPPRQPITNLTPDNLSGLAVGDVVSVEGWLFPYGAVPQICKADAGCAPIGEIAVETVVGRPGPTPLF